MANAFEDFIQLELPKRPFLASDVDEESIIVRRGQGARALAGVKLSEGQVLGMKDGQLQGVAQTGGGSAVDALPYVQEEEAVQWVITHNRNNVNVVLNLYGADGKAFEADEVEVAANTVTITLLEAAAGRAILIFV
jgi:hypothetical protein